MNKKRKKRDIETEEALKEIKELESMKTIEDAAKGCPMFQALLDLEEAVRDFGKDD